LFDGPLDLSIEGVQIINSGGTEFHSALYWTITSIKVYYLANMRLFLTDLSF